jgi:hypothetical protein
MVDAMNTTRAKRAVDLETWAENVEESDLVAVNTDELKAIAEFAVRRDRLEDALIEAVRTARHNGKSWSQIGAMLGVSKQAAQRKYARLAS